MNPHYHVSTIQRAIDVLNLFKTHSKLSFTSIQEMLGFNKSTLFRVLRTLEYNRYLARDKNGLYELGISVLVLGNQVSRIDKIKRVAGGYLKSLCDETHFTFHIGVLDGLEVVIIDKHYPQNSINTVSRIGRGVPAHCTGQGKAILAYLPSDEVRKIIDHHGLKRYTPHTITTVDELFWELERIRERGYAIDNSEHEKHTRCVAVPILNSYNEVEAAISLTGLTLDLPDDETITHNARMLMDLAEQVRMDLGYKGQK
ncbi:MAG TPA: IclR family transcriptional regulator [Corynebacteriales bacterium]|jgi:DNA-binding IclR family transcriptional regulator|nr:IclR family transcriptional regulator [Mycobacteriales bacterium]